VTLRHLVAAAGLATSAALLSGCTGAHPGVAVQVGDDTVSLSKLDSTSLKYCAAYRDQIKKSGTSLPMGYARQVVVSGLADRLLGEQLASKYAVKPSQEYSQFLAQVNTQFKDAGDDAKQAVIDVEGGAPYLQTVQISIGTKLLAAEGKPSTDQQAELTRGQQATAEYLKSTKVQADPVLGLSFKDGKATANGDSTAYGVSAAGKVPLDNSATPDAGYTSALTGSQRCE
jgi:hypothetical protein